MIPDLDVVVAPFRGVFHISGNAPTCGSTIIGFVCDSDHAQRIAALLNTYGIGDSTDLTSIERGTG